MIARPAVVSAPASSIRYRFFVIGAVSLAIVVLSSVGGGAQVLAEAVDTEVSDREVSTSY